MNKIEQIKEIVLRDNLKVRNRSRRIVYQRFYLFYKLFKYGLTLSEIGNLFDMNHVTVLHGLKRHELWCKMKDEIYLNSIYNLMNELEEDEPYDNRIKVGIYRKRKLKQITITGNFTDEILDNLQEYMTINEFCQYFISDVDKS